MCPHGYHHSGSMATPALGTRDVSGSPSYCVSMFIRQACFVGVDPPLVRN